MPEILSGKEYVRKLINIAYLNIGIPLLFFAWVYLESNAETLIPKVAENQRLILFIPIVVTSLVFILFGHKKHSYFTKKARKEEDFVNKLVIYQKATTHRFIFYSISSLLITFGFFMTDFQPFAALFGIMIVLFSINHPNAKKVADDLRLKDDNRKIILEGLDLPNS